MKVRSALMRNEQGQIVVSLSRGEGDESAPAFTPDEELKTSAFVDHGGLRYESSRLESQKELFQVVTSKRGEDDRFITG